jgi:hypothetical protein
MAKLKITPKTTVAELKKQFLAEVGGGVLRVYDGRSEAKDDATLASIGAKEGETAEFRTSRTVGKFEEAVQQELNLKVKVYTNDNWVKVLDGITLAVAAKLPNGMTKAKMEEYLSYQRSEQVSEKESTNGSTEESNGTLEIPSELKGIPSFVDIEVESLPWPMSEEELEEKSDELDVDGVVLAYAYDKDGDFDSRVFTNPGSIYDLLCDNLTDWCQQYSGRRFEIFISTKMKTLGEIAELENDEQDEAIGRGLSQYIGAARGFYWEINTKCLFRVTWPEKTDVFTINSRGYFDCSWSFEEDVLNYTIEKIANGDNQKELPNIPVVVVTSVDIDSDWLELATHSNLDEAIFKISNDISRAGKYGGVLYASITMKDSSNIDLYIEEPTVEGAVKKLAAELSKSKSGIDYASEFGAVISAEAYQIDLDKKGEKELIRKAICRYRSLDSITPESDWKYGDCIFLNSRRGRLYLHLINEDGWSLQKEDIDGFEPEEILALFKPEDKDGSDNDDEDDEDCEFE